MRVLARPRVFANEQNSIKISCSDTSSHRPSLLLDGCTTAEPPQAASYDYDSLINEGAPVPFRWFRGERPGGPGSLGIGRLMWSLRQRRVGQTDPATSRRSMRPRFCALPPLLRSAIRDRVDLVLPRLTILLSSSLPIIILGQRFTPLLPVLLSKARCQIPISLLVCMWRRGVG